jgi:hypothetical protein
VPFSLKVTDDVRQGGAVHLLVELIAFRSWTPDEVGLRVVTFSEGSEITSRLFRGSKLFPLPEAPEKLRASGSQEFVVSFTSEPFAYYELKLLWGGELKRALAEAATEEGLVRFVPQAVKLVAEEGCKDPVSKCEARFVAEGTIFNGLTEAIDSVVLGVRYVSDTSTAGDHGRTTGEEQQIELSSLALAPGTEREIKMNIGKGLPQPLASRMRPEVRVISFSLSSAIAQ